MRALVFDGDLLRVREVPRAAPAGGEALVRTRLAGICGTDLEILRGYKNFRGILGHEFVGQVVECEQEEWVGKRVCGEINIGCGECAMCAHGVPGHCASRTVTGILNRPGAFAEYIRLPTSNLHCVPDSVDDESAVFVEPLAAAFRILQQLTVSDRDRVAVLGDGRLGILCARVLVLTGANVTMVGRHPEKLALLQSTGVATQLVGAGQTADQFDVVVEATGSAVGFATALEITRHLGTLVLKSTAAQEAALDLTPAVVKEVTVIGSRCGPFPLALDALEHNRVEVRDLISARYSLEDGPEAFERAAQPGTLKVLLET